MGLDSVVLDGIRWGWMGLGGIEWDFVRFCGIRLNLVQWDLGRNEINCQNHKVMMKKHHPIL